jgi:hypothetical protein
MNSTARTALLAMLSSIILLSLGGCTPLAKTSYPVAWDDGLVGAWRFEFNPDLAPPDHEEPAPVLRGIVSRKPGPENQPADPPGGPASVWPRLKVSVMVEGVEPETYEIVGGLLRARSHLYFTFQQSAAQSTPAVSLLHTPLQHTLRVERDGDILRLWGHRVTLLWTPMELAGTLTASLPPADSADWSRMLVQNFDDIIAYYEKVPEETWVLLGTATRIVEQP